MSKASIADRDVGPASTEKQEQKLVQWRLGIIFGAALLLVLMAFGATGCAESESPDKVDSPDEAAVPTPSDSASDAVLSCTGQQYVLCIAASCDQTTGECGVMPSGDSWVPCTPMDRDGVCLPSGRPLIDL